jgi:cation diffusion facilitator family transporter
MTAKNNQTDQKVLAAAWLSVVISFLVFSIKFFAYLQTHSTAVLSDALESIVNIVASVVALLILRAVAEPADEDHPYGHGKLEYFSAAFEGGLIFLAAIVIAFGAGEALLRGGELQQISEGIGYMIASAVVNLALALRLRSVGKRHKSAALNASSKHIMSDVFTTAGVVLSLGVVKISGWNWIDPVVAVIMAVVLLLQGRTIIRHSIAGLIDERDETTLTEFAKLFSELRRPGMIDVHNLKFIRSGRFHHIDAHLVVPEFWDVLRAHEMNDEFENLFMETYPFESEVAFHLDPCFQKYCRTCDLTECPVRKSPFEGLKQFTANSLIQIPAQDVRGAGRHAR